MTLLPAEERIQNVIADLRPYFQQDGGDIEFVRFADGIVFIRLHGCCVGCAHGMCMLYQTILEHIREQVPEATSVQNVSADAK